MSNLKDPPGLVMSVKAGVTLTKVNAGQELPPKNSLQPYNDEFGGIRPTQIFYPHCHCRRERCSFS
jgi:hypothetical protein